MRARFAPLLAVAVLGLLALPGPAFAVHSCCVCTRTAGNLCQESRDRAVSDSAALDAARAKCGRSGTELGADYACSFTADAAEGCNTIGSCTEASARIAPLNEDAPAAPTAPTVPESAAPAANAPFTPTVPALALPIPTLPSFSTLTVQGEGGNRYVDVPFIAEYIVAVYRYALGLIVTIAMVMVVWNGFRWLTAAGNAGQIGNAKTGITEALIGILIAFGSYAILFAINPDLVNFRSIRIDLVRTVEVDADLRSTLGTTISPEDLGLSESPSPRRRGGRSGLRACDDDPLPSFPDCPFTLTTPVNCDNANGERTQQFIAAASTRFAAEPARTRMLHVADAAVRCGVHMGSCGNTWETIARAAGVRVVDPRGMEVSSALLAPHQAAGRACVAAGGTQSACANQAKDAAYTALRSHFGASVWPDTWADALRPGDVFYIYNANGLDSSRGYGQHSAIFVSWAGGGRANVVNGGYGNFVGAGTICIRSDCGGLLTKVIQIE